MDEGDRIALQSEHVVNGLKKIYKRTILPLEKSFKYDVFYEPALEDVNLEAKPLVLLLGQYSVGKTTFIQHLIGREFPGMRIGPEPTTDKFVAVVHGPEDQLVPGNAVVMSPDQPFRTLQRFGNTFLNKFEASFCSSTALKSFTLIDSPGVLSGKKTNPWPAL
mmetsp:Transcript_5731/g.6610  ORF Transcript_5731/g.6610 Transcript_5731/m.6610 type:complete len:163 (-) Transcript_5731:1516-2004(-)